MSIHNLKIISKNGIIDLPDWINFAFDLGAYINEHGIKYRKSASVLLSLPSEQYFSQFIAMGVVDKIFSTNKQMRSIRKAVLNLGKGSRIIYQDGKSARKASVICIEPSPVFENEMILKIRDGKMERGIPEKQWIDRVILLDEEFEEIKRTRRVSSKQQIGLDSSNLLQELYSNNQLNKVAFYPGDYFYLIGNLNQINEYMSEKIFTFNNVKGAIEDFLYIDKSNSYTNGKVFSTQMKKNEIEINSETPAIFSNLNSYMKQAKYFSKNPKIIISSRTDNDNRIYEIKEELKRELMQSDKKIITAEVVEFLKINNTQIPFGIEFFSWR